MAGALPLLVEVVLLLLLLWFVVVLLFLLLPLIVVLLFLSLLLLIVVLLALSLLSLFLFVLPLSLHSLLDNFRLPRLQVLERTAQPDAFRMMGIRGLRMVSIIIDERTDNTARGTEYILSIGHATNGLLAANTRREHVGIVLDDGVQGIVGRWR